MLLVKLGVLAFLGKGVYSGFLVANLINHMSQSLRRKLNHKWEVTK